MANPTPDDALRDVIEATRERWGRVTPFRLGWQVALRGVRTRCPYEKKNAVRQYRDGLQCGTEERSRLVLEGEG